MISEIARSARRRLKSYLCCCGRVCSVQASARVSPMDINLPDVVAEVKDAFGRYEAALVANDMAALDRLFHDGPHTIRYGGGENVYGIEAIREAFRSTRSPVGLARTVITAYGRDTAVASTLLYRASTPGKVGRQMQTWVRFADGWRVVAAHHQLDSDTGGSDKMTDLPASRGG